MGIVVLELRLFFPGLAASISPDPGFSVLVVLGGVLLGLFLYDYDFPVKRGFYRTKVKENLPSAFLLDWCQKHKTELQSGEFVVETEDDATQLYFILLNGYMQPDLREKAFYFGSLYRLLADIGLVMGLGFVATIILFEANMKYTLFVSGYAQAQEVFLNVGVLQLAIALMLLATSLFFSRPNNKGERHLLSNLRNQKSWLLTHQQLIKDLLLSNISDATPTSDHKSA